MAPEQTQRAGQALPKSKRTVPWRAVAAGVLFVCIACIAIALPFVSEAEGESSLVSRLFRNAICSGPALAIATLFFFVAWREHHLLTQGVLAMAHVLDVEPRMSSSMESSLGPTQDGWNVRVRISREGRPPFEMTIGVVTRHAILIPGNDVPVRLDPKNEGRALFVFET